MIKLKEKKAAMELSIGTIVIIVLSISMLILGLILIKTIFTSGIRSVNQIDSKVRSAIDNMFIDSKNLKMAIYPSDKKIRINQGTQGEGFAYSVRNTDLETRDFTYIMTVDPAFDIRDKCRINVKEAEDWIVNPTGSFTLVGSANMDDPELILFNIPESAPLCTVIYRLDVKKEGDFYEYRKIHLTIEAA